MPFSPQFAAFVVTLLDIAFQKRGWFRIVHHFLSVIEQEIGQHAVFRECRWRGD